MSRRKQIDLDPEKILALAVIKQAIRDSQDGSSEASSFLCVSNHEFRYWCGLLGVPEELVMEKWVLAA
ncbi:hypothetical protein MYX75_00960 [Acidobacteria bacterium AH-259-A15]|nr:hypothetical protein [Acidobacteria bacterium AH-259-A15]